MCLCGDVFVDFAVFVNEFNGAISKSDCEGFTDALGEGHPIMVDGVGVEFKPLAALSGGGVPPIDDVIVADAV
jgi:hypothetical protein